AEVYYTSLVGGFPDVYRIDLQSRKRTRVARHPGLNTGGVVSPDGRKLALILSRDGNPELYVQQLPAGRLTRLTRTTHAAEASPSWSPDGSQIVYVADTSGSPQLYILSARGGQARRVTFRGS
ncbi:MAG: biopolymer transporter Tol, partial [Nitrospinaceae bacterium]|nr:biopolymer transporter Tol [Nitrospinaceae bacterium]